MKFYFPTNDFYNYGDKSHAKWMLKVAIWLSVTFTTGISYSMADGYIAHYYVQCRVISFISYDIPFPLL